MICYFIFLKGVRGVEEIKVLIDAFKTLIKQIIKQTPYAVLQNGVIVNQEQNGNYTINIKGVQYNNIPYNGTAILPPNTFIRVIGTSDVLNDMTIIYANI